MTTVTEVFLQQTRALLDLVGSAGSTARKALPEPVPASVHAMLAALRQLVDEVPPVTAELDVLVDELHAKRTSIQAMQTELGALDSQLEVLERSLAPIQHWSHQWDHVRRGLTDVLLPAAPARHE
jgi:hypothetical protein